MPTLAEELYGKGPRQVAKPEVRGGNPIFDALTTAIPAFQALRPVENTVRRALDPYVPDLDLRVKDESAMLQQQQGGSLAEQLYTGFDATAQATVNVKRKVETGEIKPDYFTGLVSSALTSTPEMFGMRTPIQSEVFRVQNPWAGLASELIGPGGVYGAAFKISKIGKVEKVLDAFTSGTVKAFGKTVTDAPIVSGMAREFWRFTPLELSRIGVGYTVWDEPRENLMWDVGMSMGLNAAFGGLGGVVTKMGKAKAARQADKVQGERSGFMPTFTLRLAKEGLENGNTSIFADDVTDPAKFVERQTQLILRAEPAKGIMAAEKGTLNSGKYVYGLTDVGDEAQGQLGAMFKTNSSKASQADVDARGLDVRFLSVGKPSQRNVVGKQQQRAVLDKLGLKDASDLAANFVYPRLMAFTSDSQAGRFGKLFDEEQGVQTFADEGVWIAKEGDGLWTVGVRVKKQEAVAGAMPSAQIDQRLMQIDAEIGAMKEARKGRSWQGEELGRLQTLKGEMNQLRKARAANAKQHGSLAVQEGDLWFIGKTDRLDLVLPKAHARQSAVIADWARMRNNFRPQTSNDIFTAVQDAALQSMHHVDWDAIRTGAMSKPAALRKISDNIKAALQNETVGTGLAHALGSTGEVTLGSAAKLMSMAADSRAIENFVNRLYDVMAPTARKKLSSPVYARIEGLLETVMDKADELTNLIMRGKVKELKGGALAAVRNRKNVVFEGYWEDLDSVDNILGKLDPEELNMIAVASQATDPALALSELAESGMVGEAAQAAIDALQTINKRVLDEFVRPAFEATGKKVDWLEGYIMPKVWRGENYVDVKSGDKVVWRATGTAAEAQRVADAIVKEGKAAGKNYTTTEVKAFGVMDDEMRLLNGLEVGSGKGADKAEEEIIMQALRRARASGPGIPKVRSPKGLSEQRKDLKGSWEQAWTAQEVSDAITSHYRQMLRFAAHEVWNQRWGQELAQWGEAGNKIMMEDIRRKASQFAGIEGSVTRTLNQMVGGFTGQPKSATKLAELANGLMYNLNLGIVNPTFAVLNLLTPIMTGAPWISYMQSAGSWRQMRLMDTLPQVSADGKVVGVVSTINPMKVLARAYGQLRKPDADLDAGLRRALTDGVISAQTYELGVGGVESQLGSTLKESWRTGGAWEFVKTLSTSAALKSEQMSRMVTFNAAWIVGRDVMGLADEALYRFAKNGTKQMAYGYALTDRPRLLTGPLGSTLGLFKNWSFHYIAQMMQYAGIARDERNFGPLLWMMGTSTLIGGLGATPAKALADGMVNAFTEQKTAFEWLRQNWGNDPDDEGFTDWADVVYFGLPALIGASLQSSASMPGTDLVQDTVNMFNVVGWQRGADLFKSAGAMMEYQATTGENAFANPNLRAQFLGATMPRALSRIYAATEQDAILSMRTGYPTVEGVSGTTRLLYALGFNQTSVDRAQVAGRQLWKEQERSRSLIKNLGMEMSIAIEAGDHDRMTEIAQTGMGLGLDMGKVYQSARTRQERAEGDALSRYADEDVARFRVRAE